MNLLTVVFPSAIVFCQSSEIASGAELAAPTERRRRTRDLFTSCHHHRLLIDVHHLLIQLAIDAPHIIAYARPARLLRR